MSDDVRVAAAPALRISGLSKSFRAVTALDDVTFDLWPGQVVALLGDNGAGKSTLVKSIVGLYQADRGRILVDGVEAEITSPQHARQLGIEAVHQDLALVDTLNVVDNLFLKRERVKGNGRLAQAIGWIDAERMGREAQDVLSRLNIRIPSLRREVGTMSGGQRQAVAIGRAVAFGQHIVLLDEPAAALGVEQTASVMQLVRTLRSNNVAVVLITHSMQEVLEVCDRAIVLRQGRKVADVKIASETAESLVSHIMGATQGRDWPA